MDDDDETWLTPGLSSASKGVNASSTTSSSSSKATQSDLDSWLSTSTASNIDFSTRSALSRKLKGYSDKKARRRKLRSASTVSLESVSEESSQSHHPPITQQSLDVDDGSLDSIDGVDDLDTKTLVPLAASSPNEQQQRTTTTTVVEQRSIDGGISLDFSSLSLLDSPFGVGPGVGVGSEDEDVEFKQLEEDEEYKQLEEETLGLSMQEEREDRIDDELETTQDDDEFLSAASEFEDDELEAAHQNGRSRELESLDEEPVRSARHQMLGGARLGVIAPRSSSVSPRLATTINSANSTPKTAVSRVVSSEITNTPVSAMNTLPRRAQVEAAKGGGMSVSLHMPSGHLPPRRVPPGRGSENGGKSTVGGGRGVKEEKKKVNLHEDLAKIQDVAREQEEALRREVMGSLSANDVSNGENDARLITNSKSVELFVGKKEFHSRLPTPSRRVIPVRGAVPPRGATGGGTLPLRAAPNSISSGCSNGGGMSSLTQSRPASGQNEDSEDCF